MAASTEDDLSLREASELLGVHYMTAYRYVRTGRLKARLVAGEWRIRPSDVEELARPAARSAGTRRPPATEATRRRLTERLLAGDEPGAWAVVETALVNGLEPVDVHLDLLASAMHAVGDGWAEGSISIDEEHRAAAVVNRLVGRLGPRFRRPGRRRGTVVLAGAPGDAHSLPVALAADVVRAARYFVVDLGASVPPASLTLTVAAADRLVATGICVSVSGNDAAVTAAVTAARRAAPSAAVLVGGHGIDEDGAAAVGADAYAADARALVAVLDALPR